MQLLRTSLLSWITGAAVCVADPIVLPRDASAPILAAEAVLAARDLARRAQPDSPSGNYTPATVDCPAARPTIRAAGTLSPNETAWLQRRRANVVSPMIDFLTRANISDFDARSYINRLSSNSSALPNIGIAISGGGYRAMLNGGGFLAAADSRTVNSTSAGGIGGLLQSATYLAGLSGGNWLVGSMYMNNFSSVQTLRDGYSGSSLWQLGRSILQGPEKGIRNTADYYDDIRDEVNSKKQAGFDTSITDYWGRGLSYQLINAPLGGPNYTFSSIALADNFINADIPFPIVVADSRAPNTHLISQNSTVFEFNPFEMGSWDPSLYAFAPLRYIGSNFSSGVIPRNQPCVRGFDQAGFVMGTSSSLFNQFLLQVNSSYGTLPDFLVNAIRGVLTDIGEDSNDIAPFRPNPFFGVNNSTNMNSQTELLTLVDGGEDNQNIPLTPLIQPFRNLDVIFAVDSTADNNNWPNGSSLVATYERSLNNTIANGTSFPAVPGFNTFVNLGLNTKPTFFGCDASNTSSPTPLIVYVPNAPYIVQSNISTFNLEINNTFRNAIIRNGYDVATQANGTFDSQWPACVACAVLSRSFGRSQTTIPATCTQCFNRYCWNGTLAPQDPGQYLPNYKIGAIKVSTGSSLKQAGFVHALVVSVGVGLLQALL